MKKRFVDNLDWIEEEEMLNLTAIAQSSPGPVATFMYNSNTTCKIII